MAIRWFASDATNPARQRLALCAEHGRRRGRRAARRLLSSSRDRPLGHDAGRRRGERARRRRRGAARCGAPVAE